MKENITINIKNLIGTLVVVNTNKEDSTEKIVAQITEALNKTIKLSQETPE